MVTIDTTDAERLAGWWADRLGATVTETNGGWYVVLAGGGLPALLSFQKVDDPTPGQEQAAPRPGHRRPRVGGRRAGRRPGPRSSGDADEGFPWVTLDRPRRQRVLRPAHEHSSVPLES